MAGFAWRCPPLSFRRRQALTPVGCPLEAADLLGLRGTAGLVCFVASADSKSAVLTKGSPVIRPAEPVDFPAVGADSAECVARII